LTEQQKMTKFNVQDRIVLDEMVDTFTTEMIKHQHDAALDGKTPIITKAYWFQMIDQVQTKIDNFTTKKALRQSAQYRKNNYEDNI